MTLKISYRKRIKSTDLSSLLLSKKAVCKLLRISLNELREQELKDDFFPTRIKNGGSKQSGVKYRYVEIIEWHLRKLEQR
ncbi:transcriptional regulator [Acinetobacter indicus]|uniref:transcriptional regulator n=1 Tax=Acinetobacter indicus TaxID=756892 RepID=UPI0025772D3B|nr:transcriptional regulator [Acinetobacter indicus]MDM1243641.1 transcriptional regulator [Acinetobacter indicus]MDM1287530.1 transcriptional regulator [Acinetobacter indicus]